MNIDNTEFVRRKTDYDNLCREIHLAYAELEQINKANSKGKVYMRSFPACKEINLWTYWQGYNAKEREIYVSKEKSYSQSNGTSVSTSFKQQQVLRPEDLNQLGEDAVLIITNHGYVRTYKEGSAYYKTEPFKSQYEKIIAVNQKVMEGV